MSYNFGPQVYLDGLQPCPGGETDMGYQQIDVPLGSLVNVTFGGQPPYNLTRTVWNKEFRINTCGLNLETLDQSWYLWDVQTFPTNQSGRENADRYPSELQAVNDCVILVALELNGTQTHRVFNSANFTITEREVVDASSSARTSVGIVKSLFVAGLMILPATMALL